jgi:hypothetical protein
VRACVRACVRCSPSPAPPPSCLCTRRLSPFFFFLQIASPVCGLFAGSGWVPLAGVRCSRLLAASSLHACTMPSKCISSVGSALPPSALGCCCCARARVCCCCYAPPAMSYITPPLACYPFGSPARCERAKHAAVVCYYIRLGYPLRSVGSGAQLHLIPRPDLESPRQARSNELLGTTRVGR